MFLNYTNTCHLIQTSYCLYELFLCASVAVAADYAVADLPLPFNLAFTAASADVYKPMS